MSSNDVGDAVPGAALVAQGRATRSSMPAGGVQDMMVERVRRWVAVGVAGVMASGVATMPGPAIGAGDGSCVRTADPAHSVARLWDEAMLEAVRRDLPRPPVHARNLFHVSMAMWDAWAAYDPVADGYLVTEKLTATDPQAAREAAISYAAYRVLSERYGNAAGAEESLAEFDATMASLCYPTRVTTTIGSTPAALGNRIAATVMASGLTDGSNEQGDYAAEAYSPVNRPLIVKRPGTEMADPNRWQPLALDEQVAQNDVPIPDKVQVVVAPHWGHVTSFGLPASDPGVPIDPGAPPRLGDRSSDRAFRAGIVGVIRASSQLDPDDGVTVDISPGAIGNSDLGTNRRRGYAVNPATGEPYAPNLVKRADFARIIAEFWADGPRSETPPGHWNVIANTVTDSPGFERRIGGLGPVVDPLEWDVKLYLALNGAAHDAAVAAWGVKGFYDTSRPISLIRYMGGKGQSSDPRKPSYDPEGLPLVRGLVELISREGTRPGGRFAGLRGHVGEVAIRAWAGAPDDPTTGIGGVRWIRAVEWVPYQMDTFVTPAFAGYISGHSTYSRSAAEVMTRMTGSAFFPGGLFEHVVPAGALRFESGPTTDVRLQWATYYDAADQAGLSRIFGGIHPSFDDLPGRVTGSECGKAAWALASRYWDGSART